MPHKTWNWQQDDWPKFTYDSAKLDALEDEFLRKRHAKHRLIGVYQRSQSR
jgi:hypothetical protein